MEMRTYCNLLDSSCSRASSLSIRLKYLSSFLLWLCKVEIKATRNVAWPVSKDIKSRQLSARPKVCSTAATSSQTASRIHLTTKRAVGAERLQSWAQMSMFHVQMRHEEPHLGTQGRCLIRGALETRLEELRMNIWYKCPMFVYLN